jgi:protease I
MTGKKILMLTGEFSEEYEIFVFEQAMDAVGHRVDVICPDKKAGAGLGGSLFDSSHRRERARKPPACQVRTHFVTDQRSG